MRETKVEVPHGKTGNGNFGGCPANSKALGAFAAVFVAKATINYAKCCVRQAEVVWIRQNLTLFHNRLLGLT